MFKQFFDQFLPKAAEYVAKQALNNVKNIKDFEHNLETLQKNLKKLSAKAYDVEEEIRNGERSGRKKRKREAEEWLEDVRSIETEVDGLGSQVESEGSVIMRLMDGGGKAAQLNMQVEKLVQQRRDFGEPVLDELGTREEILLTNGMVGKASNENLETVLKLLESRQVSKIGVYGMGGVGKTTLAKHVYNRLVQQSQGRVFWITVSQEFTIRSLQDNVARRLGVDLSDENEEAIRAARLNRFFTRLKNSVLILDDLWERVDMSEVGCTFSAEGCRLIITTRSLQVCRQIGCKKLISVVKLRKDEAWKLFNETLENEAELDPQVEEIGKSMTALCGGLPLGIITVAGSMKGETAIHTWRNALAELTECVRGKDETGEVEEVFKVLKYSFDRLKRNHGNESNGFNVIQKCFLHCTLYPEDFEIGRDDLVRSFISDGLVDGRRSRRAQFEQGHSILDNLVNLCLLETCVNIKNVKMHDLVRSMALRICKGIYMVRAGERSLKEIPNQEEWTKDLEKVSFMKCGIFRIGEEISPDCPKLSTLLLSENNWLSLMVIPESFFSKMQGLCTLDLGKNYEIAMLPDSISDLTCLKSLLLEGCHKLEKVPYLGKMKALRELNLSGTAIKEAPQGLEELINLRFLSMNAHGLKMLPKGVLKLGHLEHLNIPLHIQVEIEEINNLKRLEEFSGGVNSVSDFNWFVRSRAHDVTCYRIGVSKNVVETAKFERGWPKAPNNNELELHDCNLKDEKVLGKGIMDLTINKCEGVSKWLVDDLRERFDNPTSLKELSIRRCRGIEWIMRSDGEASQLSTTLEMIGVWGLDDLKGVMEREGGEIGIVAAAAAEPPVFSSLKRLCIDECKKMRKLGLPVVSALPSLEKINIRNCEEVVEIFEEEEDEGRDSTTTLLPKLRELELEGLPRVRKVGLPAASGVPNLERIRIKSCGEIQEIFEKERGGLGIGIVVAAAAAQPPVFSSLKCLDIYKCKKMRKLGLPVSALPNLEEIYIRNCEEVEEIFQKEDEGRDSATTLPKLTTLHLEDLPRLRKVGLPPSRGVPNLEEIIIKSCGEIQEIFEAIDLWSLDDLKGAVMQRERREIAAAAAQPPMFSSLQFLVICNCNKMRKLGLPAVSALPNLEHITIGSCEEIEEIFEEEEEEEDEGRDSVTTLPKLRELHLEDLATLRKVGLPAASGVPNLEVIDISGCGEIQEVFEDEDEDEGRAAALPRLKKLWLYDLPRLKRVSKATIISNSIGIIYIKECPELKNVLPLHFDGPALPPSLGYIWVEREWWESLEWDNPLLPQLLHPFLEFEDE